MYQTILVPLDGSKRAEMILPYIERMAHCFDARILLTRVVEPHIEFSGSEVSQQDKAVDEFKRQTQLAEDYLTTIEQRLEAYGLQVRKQVYFGDVVKSIIKAAQGANVDMIAIASHGLTGLSRAFYGSVTAGVLHQVDRPLLLIRADSEEEFIEDEATTYSKILVPLDGSKRAERILPYVEKLALGVGSKVFFLQVVEFNFAYTSPYSYYIDAGLEKAERGKIKGVAESYLGCLQGEFRQKGIQATFSVSEGSVVRTIISAAEHEGADLIALASHGRTGLARVFYGSVAAGVLQRVDRPLLLIRAEDRE